MSLFKDNIEELNERRSYQKKHFWGIMFMSLIFSLIVLSFLGFSEVHSLAFFFSVPTITGVTSTFYIVGFITIVYYRWWWHGIPKYFIIFLKVIYYPFNLFHKLFNTPIKRIEESLKGMRLRKGEYRILKFFIIFIIVIYYPFNLSHKLMGAIAEYVKGIRKKNNVFFNRILIGKKETLNLFFYPKIIITDDMPRVKRFVHFKVGQKHIGNMFDFDATHAKQIQGNTNRIVCLFRDHETERLKKKLRSPSEKVRKNIERSLLVRKNEFINKNTPSPEQLHLYKDLWEVCEGMIESYSGETDSIKRTDYPSPLMLQVEKIQDRRHGIERVTVKRTRIDSSIDVVKKGRVSFSFKMITETVNRMTLLYVDFLYRGSGTPSKVKNGTVNLDTVEGIRQFEDFFKIMFFRRLLANYGGLPSSWFVGRIESYDLRAIVSAIDRELLPTISATNNGNGQFNSDVTAASFLFTYWFFLKNEEIAPLLDGIDWAFNTTKDLSEIMVREASQQEKERIDEETEARITKREKKYKKNHPNTDEEAS